MFTGASADPMFPVRLMISPSDGTVNVLVYASQHLPSFSLMRSSYEETLDACAGYVGSASELSEGTAATQTQSARAITAIAASSFLLLFVLFIIAFIGTNDVHFLTP